ncbi:3-oxoacyl-[acyl-carrier-protein] reductase FabG-like [Pectinophora gossypiella]|uniref:3-oxoacyl-[acyl-carrier-protein] reductase FabG-like n=1 Tax=Pectinophora gossypiella TaxID=13191 RepID=UPI00214F08C2|nr:3-oxoacyl-[acyl-carrier-protein] reductase FabG-like [Pectinophora gossypiella]
MNKMGFLNKVALVTGGSSGIGAAVAARLTAEGANVAIVGRNSAKLAAVAQKCEQLHAKPLVLIGDVTKEDNVQNIVNETIIRFGKLDVLINNAGVGANVGSILAKNALEEYDRVLATNLRAIVNITNLAAPHLIQSKGNIINISSVSGLRPYVTTGFAYNASKAALDHFTKTIAGELAAKGVRVNGVNPGPVNTDIMKNMGANAAEEEKLWHIMKKGTALGRISDPEEVADLVLFLASDKAKGITGGSYTIDNGTSIRS